MIAPRPVVFEPRFKPKPWGGRKLAECLGKQLPGNQPIGESWEIVSLPGDESVVRDGPAAGRTISELIEAWSEELLGDVELVNGRFPLLVKFLDARENLSVQVHPKPPADDIKHEAWYVIDADPGARLYIGLRPGVGPEQMKDAANTPRMAELLHPRLALPGDCYYLPSGTPHALGGGIVVAEIQTPSDTTYRLYDWGRVGLDGRPRTLHVEQALENLRYDVPEDLIEQPLTTNHPQALTETGGLRDVRTVTLASCPFFQIARLEMPPTSRQQLAPKRMRVLMLLSPQATLHWDSERCPLNKGDVALLPAGCGPIEVTSDQPLAALLITLDQATTAP